MSLLFKGVATLSQLQIDADKDWSAKGISNIKEVVSGMAVGDMIYFDGTNIQKITPGALTTELMTMGPGRNPKWGWVA
jgi:hypothetical protein